MVKSSGQYGKGSRWDLSHKENSFSELFNQYCICSDKSISCTYSIVQAAAMLPHYCYTTRFKDGIIKILTTIALKVKGKGFLAEDRGGRTQTMAMCLQPPREAQWLLLLVA